MSHRDPADMQDYQDAITHQLRKAFAAELKHSQESAIIRELLQIIARLLVAIDDSPTDVLVIQDCFEISYGEQPPEVAKANSVADMPR